MHNAYSPLGERMTLSDRVGVKSNFEGCISDLKIGRKRVDFSEPALESSDVVDCSSSDGECPCLNAGQCVAKHPTVVCSCQNGFQ